MDTLMKDSAAQSYWVKRLVALIIDGIIIAVALGIIFAIIAVMVVLPAFVFGGYAPLAFLFSGFTIIVGIILILYFPAMESVYGATFGKRFMGLKVVSKTGGHPTFVEAFIRNVSKIHWLLLLLDVIIGLATTKGYQQKFSDHWVGTSVVPA
jgi:uncharacterized RDD family membrane protein YckC